jgi:lipoate-protein ligase A
LTLIRDALRLMGYPVTMNARHDLYLDEHKISGNAQHLSKGRSLHHGTVLYDANLDTLRSAIKRTSGTFEDKSVQSVRSQIANLRIYKDLGDTRTFMRILSETLAQLGVERQTWPAPDHEGIKRLAQQRYSADDWNFGYSPRYIFHHVLSDYDVRLQVSRGGKIETAQVIKGGQRQHDLEHLLEGKSHWYQSLRSTLQAAHPAESDVLLKVLF